MLVARFFSYYEKLKLKIKAAKNIGARQNHDEKTVHIVSADHTDDASRKLLTAHTDNG